MADKYYNSSSIPLPDWSKLKFKNGDLVNYKPTGQAAKVREYATGYKYPYAIWFLDKELSWICADEDELEMFSSPIEEPSSSKQDKPKTKKSTNKKKKTVRKSKA